MPYKQYIITQGDRELGLLWSDIKEHLLTPAQYREFEKWMRGQTCAVLGNLDGNYVSIVYVYDFERFIKKLPVID